MNAKTAAQSALVEDALDLRAKRVAIIGGVGLEGSLCSGVQQAFANAGANVHLIGFADWADALSSPFQRHALAFRSSSALLRPALELRLVHEVRSVQPDLVLFIKCDALHRTTYRLIRQVAKDAILAAFHPDDPFRFRMPWTSGAIHRRSQAQIVEVDHFFVWSKKLVEKSRHLNPNSHLLVFGYAPSVFRPVECSPDARKRLGSDVTFVGNWDEERERLLSYLATSNLGLWGSDYWSSRCQHKQLRSCWREGSLFGDDYIRGSLASKINLNILRPQNKGACNMRTFELPAIGAFMLHERSTLLDELFPPGEACDDFASGEELKEKVDFYLKNEPARQRIAKRGHELASRYSYDSWVARLSELSGLA